VRSCYSSHRSKNTPAITNISDNLWNIISSILPYEKPKNTVGRPTIPFRKVLNGILYVLRTGCQWKMLPKEFGSGSTCHRRFQQWVKRDIFKKIWAGLLEEYNRKEGIRWTWQSLDSISIKSPLGGR
jgi:transposase